MAAYKFTAQRGKNNRADIAVATGASEAQSDTISINIDVTAMRRGDVIILIDAAKDAILAGPWPPLA
jgi:hypothetical protein